MRIVFLGLSITSSWGNGHATNYRALVRALTERGHDVLFLERDVPWYASHRDLAEPPYGRTRLYGSLDDLHRVAADDVAGADLAVVAAPVATLPAEVTTVLRASDERCTVTDVG